MAYSVLPWGYIRIYCDRTFYELKVGDCKEKIGKMGFGRTPGGGAQRLWAVPRATVCLERAQSNMMPAVHTRQWELPVLTNVEKMKLERALGASSGYVLAFSNRTFEQFFRDVVGVEIYAERYNLGSGSKGNRLRAFWNGASDDELLKFLERNCRWVGDSMLTFRSRIQPQRLFNSSHVARLRALVSATRTGPGAINTRFDDLQFLVALSFPGTKRVYVESVATCLKRSLHNNQVFYDRDFQAHLARPDLDNLLLDIYRNRSSLIVVFLSADYAKSDWCGLEWRAVRDMIKSKSGKQLMFVRFDRDTRRRHTEHRWVRHRCSRIWCRRDCRLHFAAGQ